jgi:hypothetical protein
MRTLVVPVCAAAHTTMWPLADLGSISIHEYPTTNCDGRSSSVPALLADGAAEGVAQVMAPFVGLCHKGGIPFRIGEGNSASCGGAVSRGSVGSCWVHGVRVGVLGWRVGCRVWGVLVVVCWGCV